MGQSVPSASLLMTKNWEERLIHKRLFCYPEGPRWAGEMGGKERHQVQLVELRSPAPAEERAHAPVYAGGWLTGKQLCREGSGCPDGHQMENKPAMRLGGQGGQQSPGLHSEECCQTVEGGESWGCSAWRREGSGGIPSRCTNVWRESVKEADLGSCHWCPVTRGNGHQRKHRRFVLNIRTHFFPVRVMEQWHRLPRELVESPSLEIFKSHLDMVLGSGL